jgi:hypothetical protein
MLRDIIVIVIALAVYDVGKKLLAMVRYRYRWGCWAYNPFWP